MTDPEVNGSTPNLAAALAKVQTELPVLERDRTVEITQKSGEVYSYSYTTLPTLNSAVLPILARHGLAFTAFPGIGSDGKMVLRYHLMHESGEEKTGEFPISGEGGIQMVGGRITYARRYALQAVTGVAAEEDDESRLSDETAPRTAQRRAAPPPPAGKPAGKTAQRASRKAAPPALPGEEERIVASGPYAGARVTMTEDQGGDTDLAGAREADVELRTDAQSTKLHTLMREAGLTDRDEALTWMSGVIGHELTSTKLLTKTEASIVIEALAAPPDQAFPEEE